MLLLLLPITAPDAGAHSDGTLSTAIRLDPGQERAFPIEVHWHRIIGTIRTDNMPGVSLSLVRQTGPADAVLERDAATMHRLHHFIECCPDATWSTYSLVVRNPGPGPVTVDIDLRMMHDDFVVAVDRAEGGLAESALVIALIGMALAIKRIRDLRSLSTRPALRKPRAAHESVRRRAQFWIAWLILVVPPSVLATTGMVRSGTGPFTGTVTALAALPQVPGPFGAVAAFGLGVILIWFVTLHLWLRSIDGAPGAVRHLRQSGSILAGGVLVLAVAMAVEHHSAPIPLLYATAFAAPILFTVVRCPHLFRDPPEKGAETDPAP